MNTKPLQYIVQDQSFLFTELNFHFLINIFITYHCIFANTDYIKYQLKIWYNNQNRAVPDLFFLIIFLKSEDQNVS